MCFMDWRIGRLIRSVYHSIPNNGGGTLALPFNACRVGWTLSPGMDIVIGRDVSVLMFARPVDHNGSGIGGVLIAKDCPLHVTIATHGDLPTHGWHFSGLIAAGDGVGVIEYIAPEDVLTLGLEHLRKEYPGFRDFKPPAMAYSAGGSYADNP